MKKTIFSIEQKVDKSFNKTNVYHPFTVNEHFDKLIINFSYSPKDAPDHDDCIAQIKEGIALYAPAPYDKEYTNLDMFLPIKNLFTLSLDKRGEYIGAAHRHANNQVIEISPNGSTYGFIPCEIEKCDYTIVISFHAALCDAQYKIEVMGETL